MAADVTVVAKSRQSLAGDAFTLSSREESDGSAMAADGTVVAQSGQALVGYAATLSSREESDGTADNE